MNGRFWRRSLRAGQGLTAERFAAREVAADLRAPIIDRAKPGRAIQGHAHSVGMLIEAANTLMFDHEFLRYIVEQRIQLHHEVAAESAASTGGKVGVERHSGGKGRRYAEFAPVAA
jgi:hypothetical protein